MKGERRNLRVAPIIHSRTYNCDFNSEFLVRPDCFLDNDIKWARKYILNATGAIDGIQGERWVLVDNEKYRLAGVVGFLKNICEKCKLSAEELDKSESMFCDDKGRLVYAFIGVIIDKKTIGGKISYDFLWKNYLELVFPIWKRTYQEVITKGFKEEPFEQCSGYVAENPSSIGIQKFYETNSNSDFQRFEYFLGRDNSPGFSYCSNICDFNLVRQSDFQTISTSQNIITRLKRVTPQIMSSNMSFSENRKAEVFGESNNHVDIKKKSFIILMSCLVILLIIILILL